MLPNILSNVPKKQRSCYSGKKKRHTLKAQIVIDKKTGKVICVFMAKGREHDFGIFKRTQLPLHTLIKVLADKGYQGLQNLHSNSQTPTRKPRKQELSKVDKQVNTQLAKERIGVEHVIRKLKVWRILKETYRNRRRRFGLRLHLIAAIINFDCGL